MKRSGSSRASLALLAASTALSLGACAGSTPRLERAHLPAAPVAFGKPVPLPEARIGKSLRVFALENRAAAIQANARLEADAAFYEDVQREFGQ